MNTFKDRALLESVRKHLMQDQRLAGQSLCITASNGYIQISGNVDTIEQKQLALDMAHGVVGVHSVEDKLEVRQRPEE